jgi:hypothetical protein
LIITLPARAGVHVEDQIKLMRFAPREQVVHEREAVRQPGVLAGNGLLLDGQGEQVVVHRQTDGIKTRRRQRRHVRLAHVIREPCRVERLQIGRADEFGDFGLELLLIADDG